MQKDSKTNNLNRIIDANVNRATEGLRVCEEVTRFILNSRNLTLRLKKIRHRISQGLSRLPARISLIKERNSLKDVGKNIYVNELKRKNYADIFFANMQRVKESIRVLEEFSKLKDTSLAREFKRIRYAIYGIEKSAVEKIASLRNCR